MKPRAHQLSDSLRASQVLEAHQLVYLNAEERTGKTCTAVLTCEETGVGLNVLIVTKKKALEGWEDFFSVYKAPLRNLYSLVNYHKAHKETLRYDIVILDEAHCYISGYPKPGLIHKQVKKVVKGAKVIFVSATPHAQGYQLLYHQFAVTSHSPWSSCSNFYAWFKDFGIPKKIKLGGRLVNQYTHVKEEKVIAAVKHLFVGGTRRDLDFAQEPEDVLHFVPLSRKTTQLYNYMMENKAIHLAGSDLLMDTPMKLRTSLHMLEGGVAKNTVFGEVTQDDRIVKQSKEHVYYDLDNKEKIDYILAHWGDVSSVVIMFQYIAEGLKLKKYFRQASILQATSNAEGVDLSKYETLVIYSQDFSTSRHTQRRARQANQLRTTPIDVHFLLVKGAVSDQVYRTVSVNKTNFVDSSFMRNTL